MIFPFTSYAKQDQLEHLPCPEVTQIELLFVIINSLPDLRRKKPLSELNLKANQKN